MTSFLTNARSLVSLKDVRRPRPQTRDKKRDLRYFEVYISTESRLLIVNPIFDRRDDAFLAIIWQLHTNIFSFRFLFCETNFQSIFQHWSQSISNFRKKLNNRLKTKKKY